MEEKNIISGNKQTDIQNPSKCYSNSSNFKKVKIIFIKFIVQDVSRTLVLINKYS